jgi:hypothetical protein
MSVNQRHIPSPQSSRDSPFGDDLFLRKQAAWSKPRNIGLTEIASGILNSNGTKLSIRRTGNNEPLHRRTEIG